MSGITYEKASNIASRKRNRQGSCVVILCLRQHLGQRVSSSGWPTGKETKKFSRDRSTILKKLDACVHRGTFGPTVENCRYDDCKDPSLKNCAASSPSDLMLGSPASIACFKCKISSVCASRYQQKTSLWSVHGRLNHGQAAGRNERPTIGSSLYLE